MSKCYGVAVHECWHNDPHILGLVEDRQVIKTNFDRPLFIRGRMYLQFFNVQCSFVVFGIIMNVKIMVAKSLKFQFIGPEIGIT